MIGAIIAKKKVQSAFDSLSRQDLDAFLTNWAEDATFIYPSPTGPSFPNSIPVIEGKEAIREWYKRFIEEWEVTSFTVKNICVQRLCTIVFGTNVVTAEWDLKVITKGGAKESNTSGVTVIALKKGKATEVRVYECAGDPIWRVIGPKKDIA